jgi:hypothetical protein
LIDISARTRSTASVKKAISARVSGSFRMASKPSMISCLRSARISS